MRMEIKLPKMIKVSDYPDFDYLLSYFKKLNRQIKIKNVGLGMDRELAMGCHYGMVYTGSIKDPENDLMLNHIRQRCSTLS